MPKIRMMSGRIKDFEESQPTAVGGVECRDCRQAVYICTNKRERTLACLNPQCSQYRTAQFEETGSGRRR